MAPTKANPTTRETVLHAYPDWIVRQYRDGSYDAAQRSGPGLSPLLPSWHAAVMFARHASKSPGVNPRLANDLGQLLP